MSQNNFFVEPVGSPAASSAPSNSGIPTQTSANDLSNLLNNLNGRLEMLETRNLTVGQGYHGSPKVSLPEKFNGSIGKCRSFLISIENIFALQAGRYPTDEIKTRFIGTLLSNEALAWFTDVVQNKKHLLDDYYSFIEEFRCLFDDPNVQRHASSTLKRLKQGRGSVLVYSTKFRQLAPDTGYNERALIDMFREGLNEEIKDSLSQTLFRSEDLDSFIKLCIQIDQRMYDRRLERGQSFNSRSSGNSSFGSNHNIRTQSFPRNIQFNRGRPPHIPQNPPIPSYQTTSPMDLDAVYMMDSKGYKHITQEEKKRRREQNLCLYCGEAGHDLTVCPKKPSKKNLNSLEISIVRFQDKLRDSSIFIDTTLKFKDKAIILDGLIDSGANSNFISRNEVLKNNLKTLKLAENIAVKMADGRTSIIDSYIPMVCLESKGCESMISVVSDLLVVENLKFSLILGIPWLRKANPLIDWSRKSISFGNQGDFDLKERSSNGLSTSNDRQSDKSILNIEVKFELPDSVPSQYEEFKKVFYDNQLSLLPPSRSLDLAINFKDITQDPPFLKIYNLSYKEELILKDWIQKNVQAGLIRPSKSPAAAPIFFVPKKDGSLRPCIDYRLLNENTVRDKHPLPLITDVLAKFSDSKVFTKLDLKGAYNLVRIKEGDEWKCAFRCKFGHFEPLVVQFGLTNAPAVFQRFVNSLFTDVLDIFVVIYLDDILIFSSSLEEHIDHVKLVMKRLQDNHLVLKREKCEFHKTSVLFLGHRISVEGISMEKDKVEAINEFPIPNNLKSLRSFLGMANYYRKFIDNYSTIVLPLTTLTRKNVPFVWSDNCNLSFNKLKHAIANDVVLKHPVLDKQFRLYCDASNYAIGAVLAQVDENALVRPIEFFSRKLLTAEINYSTYDKELLSIIEALKNWRHYLVHSPELILIFSDHNNLQFFRSSQLLKPRHARWAELLSLFTFKIYHIKGKDNVVADALSRPALEVNKSTVDSKEVLLNQESWGNSATYLNLLQTHFQDFQTDNFDSNHATITVLEYYLNATECDHDYPEDIAKYLDSSSNSWPCSHHSFSEFKSKIKNFSLIGDKLYYDFKGWKSLYLPLEQRRAAMVRYHDNLGHLGVQSVLELVKRRYYWPNLEADLTEYIRECTKCQLSRGNSSQVERVLHPIPPVALPFERWGIDFLQNLPTTRSDNNHVITMIDYSTRWVLAKPVKSMSASEVVKFLYYDVILNYGVPFEIISDRGGAFMAEELTQFFNRYQIKHIASTPYHPQTNGMVESMHRMLNHAITCAVDGDPSRWDEEIGNAVFALRVRNHAVTKFSPFKLLYGIEPRLIGDINTPRQFRAPLTEPEEQVLIYERNADELDEIGDNRAAAYQRSLAQAEKMKASNSRDEYEFKFEIGEWVKRKRGLKTKFQTNWTGPFTIVGHGFPGTYWLMTPDGKRLSNLVNETHLAKWISKESDEEVRQEDESVELVPPEEGNIDRYLGTLDLDIGREVKLDDDLYYNSSHSPAPTALDALLVPFP